MDGEGLDTDSEFPPPRPQCASGIDDGVDRISQLPDEVLFLILSLLPVRKAAATTVLSSRWLNLWKEIPNLKSDRISQLPDQILILILSFLSLKRAAATSVLSSRWSHLWKHTPNLDFNRYDHQKLNANWVETVNSVIQSHKALSLKQFRIRFFDVDKSAKSAVTEWLEFAFLRRVESLELNFSFGYFSEMIVLEESVRETSIICRAPQTLFFCQSLKSLSLSGMKVGGRDVEVFLRNCPLLEKLTIFMAVLMSDINVCGAKLMLKHLKISNIGGAKSVRLSAPNLSSFTFSDKIGKLVLEYVPKLVEADVTSSSLEFVVQHIALISQLQILTLSFFHSEKLLTGMIPHMPNLKKLSIGFISVINGSLLRLTDLIWASPRLQEFSLTLFDDVDDPSALMEDMINVERSLHQHLKVVEFETYSDRTDHLVELATYISDNCVALGKIVIRHEVEYQRDFDYLKQHLQGKVRSQIQLRFC